MSFLDIPKGIVTQQYKMSSTANLPIGNSSDSVTASMPCCGQIGVFSVSQFSRVRLFATPWTAAHQASLSITNFQSLLKLMFIEVVMPSNATISSSVVPFSPVFSLSQHQGLLH